MDQALAAIEDGDVDLMFMTPLGFGSHAFERLLALDVRIRFICIQDVHSVDPRGHDFK